MRLLIGSLTSGSQTASASTELLYHIGILATAWIRSVYIDAKTRGTMAFRSPDTIVVEAATGLLTGVRNGPEAPVWQA